MGGTAGDTNILHVFLPHSPSLSASPTPTSPYNPYSVDPHWQSNLVQVASSSCHSKGNCE